MHSNQTSLSYIDMCAFVQFQQSVFKSLHSLGYSGFVHIGAESRHKLINQCLPWCFSEEWHAEILHKQRIILTCSLWNVPFFPVKPWQITFVSLLINTAGACKHQTYKFLSIWYCWTKAHMQPKARMECWYSILNQREVLSLLDDVSVLVHVDSVTYIGGHAANSCCYPLRRATVKNPASHGSKHNSFCMHSTGCRCLCPNDLDFYSPFLTWCLYLEERSTFS